MKLSLSAPSRAELLLSLRVLSHMLFMRADGGELSLCWRRGGVGRVLGRSFDAAFRSASDGSRDESIDAVPGGGECDGMGEGGEEGERDGGRDWSPRR